MYTRVSVYIPGFVHTSCMEIVIKMMKDLFARVGFLADASCADFCGGVAY